MKVLGIITGALMCLLGVYAFCVPFRTFLGIGWAVGILLAVHGIEMLIVGLTGKKKDICKCILGVLLAIVGVILLFSGLQRLLTDVMAVYMVSGAVIVYGIYHIVTGCGKFKESKWSSIWGILFGVLSVLFGILALAHPVMTMISLGYMIACVVIVQGIDMIILAVHLGKKDEQESK